LIGIQIAGREDGASPFILDQIDCAGSIRFAWGLRQKAEFAAVEDVIAKPELEPHVVVRRRVSERSCQSVVAAGDVKFSRVSAAGCIDLTNLKLDGGSVLLNDACIGTDLFARRSWLRGND